MTSNARKKLLDRFKNELCCTVGLFEVGGDIIFNNLVVQCSQQGKWTIKKKIENIRNHCERVNQIIVMKLKFRIFCFSIFILSFFMWWRSLKIGPIHCLCEGDSETNNQASDNQNHMASSSASAKKSEEELTDSVRVLCWIMTSPDNHKTRVGENLTFYS